ncbi:hypothetical protein NMG60_11014088 [Bertholletia excelsa]
MTPLVLILTVLCATALLYGVPVPSEATNIHPEKEPANMRSENIRFQSLYKKPYTPPGPNPIHHSTVPTKRPPKSTAPKGFGAPANQRMQLAPPAPPIHV